MMRLRSLAGTASSSFEALRVMRSLLLATALHVADRVLEGKSWLLRALAERAQIIGIFGQGPADSGVHEIGNACVGLGGLEPKSLVDRFLEVDGSAPGVGHVWKLTLERYYVE